MRTFERLFEPIRIGSLKLRNRIVMPPISTKFGSDTGGVTDRYRDYYVQRARGGAGLIIVENTCIEYPRGKVSPTELRIDDHKFIPALNELAEAIKEHGAKAAIQLHHAGRQTNTDITEGAELVSASDRFCPVTGGQPRPLTIPEIERIVELYARAALRAQIARFDAVEIHAAHGYLISQFLSPYTNDRKDHYGGDQEGRCRFLVEIIQRMREKVDAEYPIIVRFSADEKIPEGYHIEEGKFIARKAEEAGATVLHVSAGLYESKEWVIQPMAMPPGCLVDLAHEIKKAVSIPVIAVGRINDPLLAEDILREGKADLISMGRALIADPDLPNKARSGSVEQIRKCIACNHCIGRGSKGLRIKCAVNAAVGREREYEVTPASRPKRVLVIGAGPAGMEAARVAALRGHQVTLYEKTGELGGQLRLAAAPPGKGEIKSLIAYLTHEIQRLGVEVKRSCSPSVEEIHAVQPTDIILATGAVPLVDRIQITGERPYYTVWDVLGGALPDGDRIAVIGGGQSGCETAHHLATCKKKVLLVEMTDDLAVDMEGSSRTLLLNRLRELGTEMVTGARGTHVNTDTGKMACSMHGGEGVELAADDFVLAMGVKSSHDPLSMLEPLHSNLHVIGDCWEPATLLEAIHSGSRVGREI